FLDGNTVLNPAGAIPNSNGTATLVVSSLLAGGHSFTATYSGDTNFAPSASLAALSLPIAQANSSTTVIASSSATVFGQSETFTATVVDSSAGSNGVPTGTVTFVDGATTLGTGIVNAAGVATLTTTSLRVGGHSVTASYSGDNNFIG